MDAYDDALATLLTLPRPDPHLPDGVTESALRRFADRHDLEIPEEVKAWLRRTNGPFVESQAFLGIAPDTPNDMDEVYARYPHWRDLKWLPVASDGCGNFYVVALDDRFGKGHPVLFVDHEESTRRPAYLVASSFRSFVPLFIERERCRTSWPFDRKLTLRLDPGLAHCYGAPLPWEA